MELSIKSGLILIDKPAGPTSNQVAIWVREMLGTKCGHCGTLDPQVSGVLPILFGKGIKLLEHLQKHDKEYICIMKTSRKIPDKKIKETFAEFTGRIYQMVPEMAAVARKIRKREIFALELIETKNNLVLFRVHCQHGTYVRKLIDDFGRVFGTKNKMIELRRTKAGLFGENDCVPLIQLKDACELYKEGKPEMLEKIILPLEKAVEDFPKVFVKQGAVKPVCQGAPLFAAGVEKTEGGFAKNDTVALMADGKLIAIGKALFDNKAIVQLARGTVVDLEKVLA